MARRRLQGRLHQRHRPRLPGRQDAAGLRRRAGHRQRRHRQPGRYPRLRRGLPAPRTGPGPAGLRPGVRQLLPGKLALHLRPRRGHGEGADRRRPHLRRRRRAVVAHHRTGHRRRQRPRHAQERGRLHLLRARRGLSQGQVGTRFPPRREHPGQRPPRHRGARARRPAGVGRGHPEGLPVLRAAQDGQGHARRRRGQDLRAPAATSPCAT